MSNRKLIDLNDLINLSQKNIEHMEKSENISLHKRFTSNLPKVRVNVDDISFVIGNLLTNALDSMPNDGKLLIESKYCKEHDSCVQISISDTGYGIKRNKKDKIFWPFFTTKSEGKGIGMGLAISKKIIEDHGGKINVASIQAVGTTFTVCLSVAQTLDQEQQKYAILI